MNIPDLFNILFLGGASSNPCVVLYNISQQKQHTLMNIQTKSSIYAMDFNIENNTLAAATKDGFIYIINIDQRQTATEDISKYSFSHEAPVISVCWAGKSVLAVSDTTGQCLLWDTELTTTIIRNR